MERGGGPTLSASKPSLFAVYQHPAFSAALTSNSLRPSASNFLVILSIFSAAGLTLLFSISRENAVPTGLGLGYVSQDVARICSKVIPALAGIVLLGTLLAFFRAFSQWRARNSTDVVIVTPSKGTKEITRLSKRQGSLLGLSPKLDMDMEVPSKKPLQSKICSASRSELLAPLHPSVTGSDHLSRPSGGKSSNSSGSKVHNFSTPSRSPATPSMYLVPAQSMRSPVPLQSLQSSPGTDHQVTTPWSKKRPPFHKDIATEEDLKRFLEDVDEKISETISKLGTPSPTVNGFGVSSPNTMVSSVNTSGTTRSTPLRPVRMSPGSQKFTTPPKKGELDLPPPMSIEESIEAFEKLGIYMHIEQWRDRLRQWFSSVVLNPLLRKIETSHLKVIEAAAKLNISITLSQVGSDTLSTPAANVSQMERTNEWKPSFAVDEDGLLHQLRVTLIQLLDAAKLPSSTFQQIASIPVLQEAIDAIVEHQRLYALMKGEWAKGLLPQSSVRADYTVQRIRRLAEGTCVKNYDYLGNGEVCDNVNKKWNLELPSDSHLLLYLFCAFLEYPNWMLHVDPTTFAGAQGGKNPLFLGVLPPKESFPEKYIAVISSVPSVPHPGACVLAVGKQSPPVFALYWDKKPQLSFQGRTALWDSILLLCYKIKVSYGGFVRGVHISSPALAILPVLEEDTDD